MNTKTNEGARNEVNPYFLRAPWNKGGLVNTGPEVGSLWAQFYPQHKILIFGNFNKITSMCSQGNV